MKGAGYYDLHSEYQRRIIESGAGIIREVALELELGEGEAAVAIVDYGCGTGATSLRAMRTALDGIRARHSDRTVLAIHSDLPSNDFNQVFANLGGPEGYLGAGGGPVYAAAVPGSFFTQVLPSATVHLGLCSNAAHWFREQPSEPIEAGIYHADASGEALAALSARAASDWMAFLEARCDELASGGRMVIQGIGTAHDEDGATQVSASRLLSAMWEIADGLAAEGMLDGDALGRYVFPVYCRSLEEVTGPATDGGRLRDALEVTAAETAEVPNPYWGAFEHDRDADAYAEVYTQFVRAFAESTLTTHLFVPAARSLKPGELCEEFFSRLERSIADDPEASRYEAWVTRVAFRRN